MRRFGLIALIAVSLGTGWVEAGRSRAGRPNAVAVAFFDGSRLQHPEGQAALKDFEYYFMTIHDIVKRDFPNVELRILTEGELLHLPDGSSLNVQNMRPEIGYVLSAAGKKKRVMVGVQTDADFACAAAKFFSRSSKACPK